MDFQTGRITADISGSVTTINAPAVADFANLATANRQSAGTTTVTVPANHVYVLFSAVCAAALDSSIFFDNGTSGQTIASAVASTRWSSGTWNGYVKLTAGQTFAITGNGVVCYYDFTV